MKIAAKTLATTLTVVAIGLSMPSLSTAQTEDVADPMVRLHELEAELANVRRQLDTLEQERALGAGFFVRPATYAPLQDSDPSVPNRGDLMDEIRKEIATRVESLAWKKGDCTILPYGIGWGYVQNNTHAVAAGDIPLYVLPNTPVHDVGNELYVSARTTRFGFDASGCEICTPWGMATIGAKIEADFHGALEKRNHPNVRLRHGYAEIKNEHFRFLAGQTWDVISPLIPRTINHAILWYAGNIGHRHAQIRFERYWQLSPSFLLTAQSSISSDLINDYPSTIDGLTPKATQWPIIQGRLAGTFGYRGEGCYPWTYGLSGHIGEHVCTCDPDGSGLPTKGSEHTWSLCVDFNMPLNRCIGVKGEYQIGENLDDYMGGIGQGVSARTRQGVYDRGGWFDVWYEPSEKWKFHTGAGIDDPIDTNVDARTYNWAVFWNVAYHPVPKLLLAFEVSQWRTGWVDQPRGDATVFRFDTAMFF